MVSPFHHAHDGARLAQCQWPNPSNATKTQYTFPCKKVISPGRWHLPGEITLFFRFRSIFTPPFRLPIKDHSRDQSIMHMHSVFRHIRPLHSMWIILSMRSCTLAQAARWARPRPQRPALERGSSLLEDSLDREARQSGALGAAVVVVVVGDGAVEADASCCDAAGVAVS